MIWPERYSRCLFVEPAIKLAPALTIRPSIAERTVTDPDQFSAVSVSSHRAQVHLGHRNETLFPQQGSPSFFIFEAHGAQQQAALKIKFLPV